jgi:hypothetical protein
VGARGHNLANREVDAAIANLAWRSDRGRVRSPPRQAPSRSRDRESSNGRRHLVLFPQTVSTVLPVLGQGSGIRNRPKSASWKHRFYRDPLNRTFVQKYRASEKNSLREQILSHRRHVEVQRLHVQEAKISGSKWRWSQLENGFGIGLGGGSATQFQPSPRIHLRRQRAI